MRITRMASGVINIEPRNPVPTMRSTSCREIPSGWIGKLSLSVDRGASSSPPSTAGDDGKKPPFEVWLSKAKAVLVAATAASSGSIVSSTATCAGGLDEGVAVFPVKLWLVDVAVVVALKPDCPVGLEVLVGVAAPRTVLVGRLVRVGVCVMVEVAMEAFVLVDVGVFDGRGVFVGGAWVVSVEVGVFEGSVFGSVVAVGVEVGGRLVGVAVGGIGGAVTVNVPEDSPRLTELPPASVAVALLKDRLEEPGVALLLTLKVILATLPFEIAVKLRPKMMTRIRPDDGDDQESVFPAEEAADPIVTFWTDKRLASKFRSKFKPVTSVPEAEFNDTGIPIPEAPGNPEPLPADRLALPLCACTGEAIIVNADITTNAE